MKLFNDYQLYLEAQRNGERNIRFESIKSDDVEYIVSKPFSAVQDFNESIRNGAA